MRGYADKGIRTIIDTYFNPNETLEEVWQEIASGRMPAIGVRTSHPTLEADIVVGTLGELPDEAFEPLLE